MSALSAVDIERCNVKKQRVIFQAWNHIFDPLSPEIQLERASRRDSKDFKDIQAIMDAQMSRQDKCQRADWIFDNSLSIDSIAPRVQKLHQTFIDQASKFR